MTNTAQVRTPTYEDALTLRRLECQEWGYHGWEVIEKPDIGPVRIRCRNCGQSHEVTA